MTEETKYFVFYSRVPNSSIIFPDGTLAGFVGGRYTTQDPYKASILQEAIKAGNASLYVDADKPMLTEAELDPMAELKARIIAEYEANKAGTEVKDMGTSDSGKLNVADTSTISQLAAESSSGATAGGISVTIPTGAK